MLLWLRFRKRKYFNDYKPKGVSKLFLSESNLNYQNWDRLMKEKITYVKF